MHQTAVLRGAERGSPGSRRAGPAPPGGLLCFELIGPRLHRLASCHCIALRAILWHHARTRNPTLATGRLRRTSCRPKAAAPLPISLFCWPRGCYPGHRVDQGLTTSGVHGKHANRTSRFCKNRNAASEPQACTDWSQARRRDGSVTPGCSTRHWRQVLVTSSKFMWCEPGSACNGKRKLLVAWDGR